MPYANPDRQREANRRAVAKWRTKAKSEDRDAYLARQRQYKRNGRLRPRVDQSEIFGIPGVGDRP